MSPRFDILDAEVTRVDTASPQQSIVTESVRPYPSRAIYDSYRNWDGVIWWFPQYGMTAFLGGAKKIPFVPDIMTGTDLRVFAKMSTGASWRVLIHETFHGFGTLLKVDAGHSFAAENRAKWPGWYASIVTGNNGVISELAWYEETVSRRDNSDKFAPVRRRGQDWIPSKEAFSRAELLNSSLTGEKAAKAESFMKQADIAAKKKKHDEEIRLLSRAISAAPELPGPVFQIAYRTQWHVGNMAAAVPLYEDYLKKFGGFENTDTVLIYLGSWYLTTNPSRGLELIEIYGGNPLNDGTRTEISARKIKLLRTLKRNDEADALQKSLGKK
jgi:hypothetical protein